MMIDWYGWGFSDGRNGNPYDPPEDREGRAEYRRGYYNGRSQEVPVFTNSD